MKIHKIYGIFIIVIKYREKLGTLSDYNIIGQCNHAILKSEQLIHINENGVMKIMKNKLKDQAKKLKVSQTKILE